MTTIVQDANLWMDTITPMSYRDRITVEFELNGISYLFNTFLCIFFLAKKELCKAFQTTVAFVTFGSFLLNIPLLLFQFWMVINTQLGSPPRYSVFLCSFFKNVASSTTSCYQVLPFTVGIYRYRTVVRKNKPAHASVYIVHGLVCIYFIILALLNYPFGQYLVNDVCQILRFSDGLEIVRMVSTLGLNLTAVAINCRILMFVKRFEKENPGINKDLRELELQKRREQLTISLLIQSTIPILVSLPLLLGSLEFYFGIKLPGDFANRWYATTFLGPFLMPFSSMLSLSTIRTELFYCIPRIKRPEKRLPVEAFVTTVPRVSVLSVTNSEYRRS